MTIRVLFFAIVRERAGVADATLELPDGSTVSAAVGRLVERWPALRGAMSGVAFAVNQSYAVSSTILREGDELALIPPVSGG